MSRLMASIRFLIHTHSECTKLRPQEEEYNENILHNPVLFISLLVVSSAAGGDDDDDDDDIILVS